MSPSSVLRIASFLKPPGCYLSPVFVADLTTLSQQVAALVQPCQDQVELERKKGKKLTKAALPASVSDPQLKALKLGFKPPKRKDGDCGGGGVQHHHYYYFDNHYYYYYYYVIIFTALTYSTRCMKVFRKRMRGPLMCQRKYKRTRILMNIKISLHTAAAEDESVRYEQRDQERESGSRRWSKIQGDVTAGDR